MPYDLLVGGLERLVQTLDLLLLSLKTELMVGCLFQWYV